MLQLENCNPPGRPRDLFSLAGKLIELLAVYLDGGIHGRKLVKLPRKAPERGFYTLACDRDRFFFQNLACCVLRVCDGAEPETRDVFLFGGLKKFDSARGSADENGKNPRRHRVQRSAVPDALFVEHAAQLRGYVLTRPAIRLVDNQNSVCHTQRSRMIPRWARSDKIACLAPGMPPGTVAPAAAACPPPPRALQSSEAL